MKMNFRSGWILFAALVLLVLSSCSKEKSVESGNTSQPNSWRFTQGNKLYSGGIDNFLIETVNGVEVMSIEGSTTDGIGLFGLAVGGTKVAAGAYVSPLAYMVYLENEELGFESDLEKTDFKVTISQLDSEKVLGTFSGKVLDANGAEVEVVSGSFYVTR